MPQQPSTAPHPVVIRNTISSPPLALAAVMKGLRVRERVGMRNAQRVLGDAAVVAEGGDRGGVLEPRRAQHQPLGLEDGNASSFQRSPVRSCSSSVIARAPQKRRGEPASRLPSWNPYGSAGSMDAGGPND